MASFQIIKMRPSCSRTSAAGDSEATMLEGFAGVQCAPPSLENDS